jgi:N-acetylmuramic acid 6-phosphate (MurNAc-6-P) etherase
MTDTSMDKPKFSILIIVIISIVFINSTSHVSSSPQETAPPPGSKVSLLKLLGLTASSESIDYIQNKTQFQLHTLLTEQRHPKTWNLSERIQKDVADGLRMLFSVDEDITKRLETLASDKQILEPLVSTLKEAIFSQNKIYIYGCGATGRLAKQMESSFWRPFWRKIKADEKIWSKLKLRLSPAIEDELIGEMTGADRALISSLEGFEDLQLIGRLQLADRAIKKGNVVIGVTEGGETSSVIGTILAALDLWKENGVYDPDETRKKLYFIYNNPDDRLLPFLRSRRVIEEPGITKINLTTGPQAITGSTRMQATTSETFVIGNALQEAVKQTMEELLSKKEMAKAGFDNAPTLDQRLRGFSSILEEVKRNIPAIADLTALEADTYSQGRFSTYFARKAMITVFIDSTERSPTFRLYPLDTTAEPKRKCWIQVWTPARSLEEAWQAFLGRPFRGLSPEFYQKHFEEEIEDPYLRQAALESLKRAGNDQQNLYDFSFSESNIEKRGPKKADLGVMILISPEEEELKKVGYAFRRFADLFLQSGARLALIVIGPGPAARFSDFIPGATGLFISLRLSDENDPFGVGQQVGLKMLLNAHSTAVMTRLGKVIGNTMTNVSPSNLKLIGRATYLIQSHVNDVLARPAWVRQRGLREPISYGEANAVLFDSIAYLKDKREAVGQTAEVALSIIRILESLRQDRGISNEEALELVQKLGLNQYLGSNLHN